MRRVLVTHALGLVGSRVALGILAAGRGLRIMAASPTRAAEVLAKPETTHAPTSALVAFIAIDRDHGPVALDAIAGSEFLDDRIRLSE
jgi:nucleoside-diphosphate-sugar epimerase